MNVSRLTQLTSHDHHMILINSCSTVQPLIDITDAFYISHTISIDFLGKDSNGREGI